MSTGRCGGRGGSCAKEDVGRSPGRVCGGGGPRDPKDLPRPRRRVEVRGTAVKQSHQKCRTGSPYKQKSGGLSVEGFTSSVQNEKRNGILFYVKD